MLEASNGAGICSGRAGTLRFLCNTLKVVDQKGHHGESELGHMGQKDTINAENAYADIMDC